jgi:hypothetical protein
MQYQDIDMDFLVDMFGMRDVNKSEDAFFKKRPEVGGMMTDDNKIILNPYSKLKPNELQGVAQNEALRLLMKLKKINPEFELTDEQVKFFKGSEYENSPEEAKKSILARILTGDPSAQSPSEEQLKSAEELKNYINTLNPKGVK